MVQLGGLKHHVAALQVHGHCQSWVCIAQPSTSPHCTAPHGTAPRCTAPWEAGAKNSQDLMELFEHEQKRHQDAFLPSCALMAHSWGTN